VRGGLLKLEQPRKRLNLKRKGKSVNRYESFAARVRRAQPVSG
jgi:hypothetical protein